MLKDMVAMKLIQSMLGDCNPLDPKQYSLRRGLLHIAALHNRPDIITWLYDTHGMDIKAIDSKGISVLKLATISGSSDAKRCVEKIIAVARIMNAGFRYIKLKQWKRLRASRLASAIMIQKHVRGYLVYRRFGDYLKSATGSWKEFKSAWGAVTDLLQKKTKSLPSGVESDAESWSMLKLTYNLMVEAEMEDEIHLVASVTKEVLESMYSDDDEAEEKCIESGAGAAESNLATKCWNPSKKVIQVVQPPLDTVEFTSSVTSWLDRADGRYRNMFLGRIHQLAEGQRSYALSKPLKGSKCHIFETKLDAGQRILWTNVQRLNSASPTTSILVHHP